MECAIRGGFNGVFNGGSTAISTKFKLDATGSVRSVAVQRFHEIPSGGPDSAGCTVSQYALAIGRQLRAVTGPNSVSSAFRIASVGPASCKLSESPQLATFRAESGGET